MMKFRIVKESLINLLGLAADNRYRVIGYRKQGKGATEIKDNDRTVEIYYNQGSFPKSAAGLTGPVSHDMTFNIDLSVSKAAIGDLATLDNPNAGINELATALVNFQKAAQLADSVFDELFDVVYQELMDARNLDLGLTEPLGSRWIESVQKDAPLRHGSLVVLTGSMQLTCTISEPVPGETPSTAGNIIETDLEIETDDFGKAGTLTGS